MDQRVSVALSLAMMVLFAYVTSFYPDYMGLFFVLYIAASMALMLAITGRGAVRIVRDIDYIKEGKPLLVVDRSHVDRLRSKDGQLGREMKGQRNVALLQSAVLILFLSLFIFPGFRDAATRYLSSMISNLGLEEKTTKFLVFLTLYFLFFVASYGLSFYSSRRLERAGGQLMIPSFYTVTDRGLVLEARTPLKAPLKLLDIAVDTRRRFVELKIRSPDPAGRGGLSRVRLYYSNPRELEGYIRSLAEEGG